jgi:hypothetical protein
MENCWIWTGARNSNGYGRMAVGGGLVEYVHRMAYFLWVSPVIHDEIDHLCFSRSCWNPAHLEDVTREENQRRMGSAKAFWLGYGVCVNGHPITEDSQYTHRGDTYCRTCHADSERKRRLAKRVLAV